jgi:tRNA-specific 2-thiouridylase
VIYQGDRVLGGGWISTQEHQAVAGDAQVVLTRHATSAA